MPTIKPQKLRSESTEQITFFARLRHFHPSVLAFAIPNGGKREAREAAKLKNEGVLAGVPDLMVALPKAPHHGLFIEMKRSDGGKVSGEQSKVHEKLRKEGYLVVVAYGVEDAYSAFLDYVKR
jgi:hypothetical protein